MKPKIKIEYDGSWPNLCRGNLVVYIDETRWDFGSYVLSSGGSIECDDDWNMWATEGSWYIDKNDFPKGFPMELYDDVMEEINGEIMHGCCGGCI